MNQSKSLAGCSDTTQTMACPFPHTTRDKTWLAIGIAVGAAIGYYFKKAYTTVPGDIRHVVLFKFKEGVAQEDIDEFIRQAKLMPNLIKEIKTFEIGYDLGLGKAPGSNHPVSIVASFKSSKDYLTYATHPEHLKVVALVKPLMTEVGGRSACQTII
jgi:hypothetical protein